MDKKILLIDDDPGYSQMAALYLSREYDVATADGVASGLAALRDSKPDLVLLDLAMPVASGFDFLERLPVECPECAGVPIVALTAARVDRLRPRMMSRLGTLTAIIEKPFELSSLGRQVDAALAGAAELPGWARL